MGGFRPKRVVADGIEPLYLAKITSVADPRPVERVELVTLTLGCEVGIREARASLHCPIPAFQVPS